MRIIDRNNYKIEGYTAAFAFVPSMHSKSSISGNMIVFEDLMVNQIGIIKKDLY